MRKYLVPVSVALLVNVSDEDESEPPEIPAVFTHAEAAGVLHPESAACSTMSQPVTPTASVADAEIPVMLVPVVSGTVKDEIVGAVTSGISAVFESEALEVSATATPSTSAFTSAVLAVSVFAEMYPIIAAFESDVVAVSV